MLDLRFAPRDPSEPNRGTTPLELLFDLAAVVAIGMLAQGLAGALAAGNGLTGLIDFLCGFFMIWWAWMNYTWFASAYDDGSPGFRLLSMLTMFGALVLAAGASAVFTGATMALVLAGFSIMRLAMATFWIGASRGDPPRRVTARRYAAGIILVQGYWLLAMSVIPPATALFLPAFLIGAIAELAVPAWAERHTATAWHRGHIISRYGRLTLIVLGQSFAAIVVTINDPGALDAGSLWQALLFAIIAFAMWGLYFTDETQFDGHDYGRSLLWGYGHFFIFGTGAAVGASMRLLAGDPAASAFIGIWVLGLPLALYAITLWVVRDRYCLKGLALWWLPGLAAALLVLTLAMSAPLEAIALTLAAGALLRRRASRP